MRGGPLGQAVWLAYRDFVHERRMSLCFVLALMAVLAPLLVLFGLKFGLIDTVAQRLIENPNNTEIVGVGSGRYDAAWFEAMAARPEVAFVVPNTRSIAAGLAVVQNPATGSRLRGVQMIPTKARDPLLAELQAFPTRVDQVVLSSLAATKLGAAAGSRLEGRIERQRDGRIESVALDLDVVAVAPDAALPTEGAFVTLDLLQATEDYRDGLAVRQLGWRGEEPPSGPRYYPRFRLYAKSIYDVADLRADLIQAGLEVRTKSAEIAAMQSLDRNLGRVFWLIAVIGGVGFLMSLAANLQANVDRKRRELSVLRLIGFPTWSIILLPLAQAAFIAFIGTLVAIATYFVVASLLNVLFAENLRSNELICRLLPQHFVIAVLLTVSCAVAASGWAGYRASRIDPAEGVRDV